MKYSQIIKNEIILASQSKVRKEILEKNNIKCKVIGSNIDEDPIKESLVNEGASPEIVSKNLAEVKATKVSSLNEDHIVIGFHPFLFLKNSLMLIDRLPYKSSMAQLPCGECCSPTTIL